MTTPDRQAQIDRLEALDAIPDTEVSPADIRERSALRADLYPSEEVPPERRRRYHVEFYVTEPPDEDGEFADPGSVAMEIESMLQWAWRQNQSRAQRADSMKLDSEVTVERDG